MNLAATSNIENKVRNTRLPTNQPMMPVFEVISNAIHSIEDAEKNKSLANGEGKIIVKCLRNGNEETLQALPEIDKYPIHSFEICDNGIGLNEKNLLAFVEADTDNKIEIGGKGVGRFVCLKAFTELDVRSNFLNKANTLSAISFQFRATKQGFHNIKTPVPNSQTSGTTILLHSIRDEYLKYLDFSLHAVAHVIVSHFQLYFIRKQAPTIIVRNQNNLEFNLATLFNVEFKSDVQDKVFYIGESEFTVYLTKSLEFLSHKIHFCAHNRSVKTESLYSKIIDLGKNSIKDESDDTRFYYQAYVVGKTLDENVDTERIGFNFSEGTEEDEEEESVEINLAKLRRAAINAIEDILSDEFNADGSTFLKKIDSVEQYLRVIGVNIKDLKSLAKFHDTPAEPCRPFHVTAR